MLFRRRPGSTGRVIRMSAMTSPRAARAGLSQVAKGTALCRHTAIEQQHVLPFDRPFNAGYEGNTAFRRIPDIARVEPRIVEGNRQDVVPQAGVAID